MENMNYMSRVLLHSLLHIMSWPTQLTIGCLLLLCAEICPLLTHTPLNLPDACVVEDLCAVVEVLFLPLPCPLCQWIRP